MSTKDQILKVSLKYFLTQGYDYTTLSQIADDIGIKKPSIYYHYKSKEDLLSKGIELIVNELKNVLSKVNDPSKSTKKQLEDFFEAIIDFNSNLSVLIGNNYNEPINIEQIFQMSSNRFESVSKTINDYYDYLIGEIERILKTGQAQGELRPSLDYKTTAIEILSRIEGLIVISSVYKKIDLYSIRTTLYENLWTSLCNQTQNKKRKNLSFKTIDLGRKW
ncbi:TetR/AcrR family transcriptional regulator [Brassicibacter mesophilus]|uniref:TetR/AcrR family transcriptional regulator n=1 Tax=Brassicibacter mesophilus TaxID=745119 RepID=UPI003D221181